MDIHQVAKKSKDFEKPYDKNNHNNNVEDVFDVSIHWNVCVDKPKKNTYNDNNE